MSEPASISLGIAARYASAVFDIARDANDLAGLESDVTALEDAVSGSPDLRAVLASPVISRDEQAASVAAIAARMGLSTLMVNTLGLMAAKRRLFVLPQLLAEVRARLADEKGEVTAEVTSATPLTPDQAAALTATLKARVGKDVKLKAAVDESLIGGLVVKLGSTMIDTSIRAKLAALKNAMKEVG